MEMKLLRPWDPEASDLDTEEVSRLKDRWEFATDLEWAVYQAKVFYEGFGNIAKAIQILEKELDRDSENPDLMFCLAECLSRSPTTLELALRYCEKGLERDGLSDYGHTIKARIHIYKEEVIPAYRSAMDALKINSHNIEAGVYLGITGFAIATAEGNIEEMEYSIKNLRITQRLNPNSRKLAAIIDENVRYLEKYKRGEINE